MFATLVGWSISVATKELRRIGKYRHVAMSRRQDVPEWEEYPHTPGVFVRVANKGLAGYGTWKSIRKIGDRLSAPSGRK